MANPPSKRRGISLDPRVDSAVSPDLLSQPAPPLPPRSEQARPTVRAAAKESELESEPEPDPTIVAEQVSALRHANADLLLRWRRQSEQLQRQLELLEQQRDQIAMQTHQLHALERGRKTSGRIGVLLVVLATVGAGALGFRHWPRLQGLAGDWNRISAGTSRLAPGVDSPRV